MSKFGFDKALSALPAQKLAAMQAIAQETQKYFGEAFDKEGLGANKWVEVQRRIPGTAAYEKATQDARTRKILHGPTGVLEADTKDSIKEVTENRAVLQNNASYAGFHNEGDGALPARPFMIQTQELTAIQLEILQRETGKIWKVV